MPLFQSWRRNRTAWYSGAYWRAQTPAARARLLGGVFFTFASIGFIGDIMTANPAVPIWIAFRGAAYTGLIAAGFAYAALRGSRLLVLAMVVIQLSTISLAPRLVFRTSTEPGAIAVALQHRLAFDSMAILISIALSYVLFMNYIRRDGERHIRLRTEVALAKTIHDRLAPPIATRSGALEFYGRAVPSSEIGGDLIDLIDRGDRPVLYVADVTGHGIGAGTIAGMVKSAMRMGMLDTTPLEGVLGNLNQVIRQLDRPELFVTCAAVAFEGGRHARVALAGHPPVLHVSGSDGALRALSNRNPPLGVVESDRFEGESVVLAPGDLLVLFTDGLTEVTNKAGEQLGQVRIEGLVREKAQRPLAEIAQALFDAARTHGPQDDDQTLVLVRVVS